MTGLGKLVVAIGPAAEMSVNGRTYCNSERVVWSQSYTLPLRAMICESLGVECKGGFVIGYSFTKRNTACNLYLTDTKKLNIKKCQSLWIRVFILQTECVQLLVVSIICRVDKRHRVHSQYTYILYLST